MQDELDKAIDELGTEPKTEPQTEVEPEEQPENEPEVEPETQPEETENDLPEVTPEVTPADLFNLLKEIQKQIEGLSSIPAKQEPEPETVQEEQPAEQDGLSLAEELGLI